MSATENYSWDFDRPPARWTEDYFSFSVGIFQWLQKASGKGLKKSPAICRVLGYTCEPERVYEKALALCARLNREGASAERPPSWLQKQYSVPRPAGMVKLRTSDEFTSGQVRSMRLKVMKERLIPAGFIVGKDASYVRRDGEQIHFINFQGYSHRLRANLGFHYTFIPPRFHQRTLPLADVHLLDCMVRGGIGSCLPWKQDGSFPYGNDREALIANLRLCADTCLDVFRRYAEHWRDPSVLLADLSAETCSLWHKEDELALGFVALRAGQVAAAEARLAEWSDHRYAEPPPLHGWLRELVDEYRKLDERAVERIVWRSWIEDAAQT